MKLISWSLNSNRGWMSQFSRYHSPGKYNSITLCGLAIPAGRMIAWGEGKPTCQHCLGETGLVNQDKFVRYPHSRKVDLEITSAMIDAAVREFEDKGRIIQQLQTYEPVPGLRKAELMHSHSNYEVE